jgi:hypothetical protein
MMQSVSLKESRGTMHRSILGALSIKVSEVILQQLRPLEENNFIIANLGGPVALNTYRLGGFQPPGSPEPAENWRWITGEPWQFTNWASGEANNRYGGDGIIPRPELIGTDEEALQFWAESGRWNDMEHTVGWGGLVVEYEIPEPATICLLGLGVLGLIGRKR